MPPTRPLLGISPRQGRLFGPCDGFFSIFESMADYSMTKDFYFFMGNLPSLFEKFAHRFLVIHDATVIADFSSLIDAYNYGVKEFTLGHFSIYECKSPDVENYIQHYASNNVVLVPCKR